MFEHFKEDGDDGDEAMESKLWTVMYQVCFCG